MCVCVPKRHPRCLAGDAGLNVSVLLLGMSYCWACPQQSVTWRSHAVPGLLGGMKWVVERLALPHLKGIVLVHRSLTGQCQWCLQPCDGTCCSDVRPFQWCWAVTAVQYVTYGTPLPNRLLWARGCRTCLQHTLFACSSYLVLPALSVMRRCAVSALSLSSPMMCIPSPSLDVPSCCRSQEQWAAPVFSSLSLSQQQVQTPFVAVQQLAAVARLRVAAARKKKAYLRHAYLSVSWCAAGVVHGQAAQCACGVLAERRRRLACSCVRFAPLQPTADHLMWALICLYDCRGSGCRYLALRGSCLVLGMALVCRLHVAFAYRCYS